MEPLMKTNDKVLFYKYLSNATIYFEYGSGGSTYQASLKDNIQKIYTVESDLTWLSRLKKNINPLKLNKITFIYCDMNTIPKTFGNPGRGSNPQQWKNYSDQILLVKDKIDLILIDGRFRVACCLKCHMNMDDNCIIAFDDFLNRREYHVILDYFYIIDQTEDKRMVFLKKKVDKQVDLALVKKHEEIRR